MQPERPWGQIIFGFAAILVSGVIILGSLSFSLLEGKPAIALLPATSETPIETEIQSPSISAEPTNSPAPPSATPSIPPPVSCPPPEGWVSYEVQPDDTLASLAGLVGQSVDAIANGNCLPSSSSLLAGIFLYLPYPASPTPGSPTPVAATRESPASHRPTSAPLQCGRPAGWTTYVVRHGDTLYNLAQRFYTTVAQLQRANCLNSSVIRVGRIIFVPNRATRTPYPSPTPLSTTHVPTTAVPSTMAPTTGVPSVPPPTTVAPPTTAPTTQAPTTPPPTTVVPTLPPTETAPPTDP